MGHQKLMAFLGFRREYAGHEYSEKTIGVGVEGYEELGLLEH